MFSSQDMKILLRHVSRNAWYVRGGGPSGQFKPHFYSYFPLKIHTPVQIAKLTTQVLKEGLFLAVHCCVMCNISKYTSQKLFQTQQKQNYNYLFEDWPFGTVLKPRPSQGVCGAQHGIYLFIDLFFQKGNVSYMWCAHTNKLLDQT